MRLSAQEQRDFSKSNKCHICNRVFTKNDSMKSAGSLSFDRQVMIAILLTIFM